MEGDARLPSRLLPTPHPRQALGPRLQSRLSSGLHFYCFSVPSFFITVLERGSRAPGLASPISHKRGRWIFGKPVVPTSPPAPCTSLPPPSPPATLHPCTHRLCISTFRLLLKLAELDGARGGIKKVPSLPTKAQLTPLANISFSFFFLQTGRGGRQSLGWLLTGGGRACAPALHPARGNEHTTHRMHARTQRFPKPPPRPRRAHALQARSHKHPLLAGPRGTANVVGGPRGPKRDPNTTPAAPQHTPGINTRCRDCCLHSPLPT